jgi:glycine cleavage system H lipoate-binding protein
MKNTITLFTGLFLIISNLIGTEQAPIRKHAPRNDTIYVFSAPELSDITGRWVDEYCSANDGQKIKISIVPEETITGKLDEYKSLAFVSSDYAPMYDESMWNMVIGREVVVPVINSENPFFEEICKKGVSLDQLASVLKDPQADNWGLLVNNNKNVPLNLYRIDDESINSVLENLAGVERSKIAGVKVENKKALIYAVQNDPCSIGICKISALFEISEFSNTDNIKLLPIDRNGNGQIDYMEKIYDDFTLFSRNVWIGKYPRMLYKNIYSICSSKPRNDTEISFLKWILTDGQKYLDNYGYTELVLGEKQSKVGMLDKFEPDSVPSGIKSFIATIGTTGLLLILLIGAIILMTAYLFRRLKRIKAAEPITGSAPFTSAGLLEMPLGLFYDKTHTWTYMGKEGLVKIGIDDFLLHLIGKVTGVKMKSEGDSVKKGDPVLSVIQNGKNLILYSPVSGIIRETNGLLSKDSSSINSSPYNDGWIYKIEPANWLKEIQFFIMGNVYREWLKNEFSRFKEFLNSLAQAREQSIVPVLQDGGELKNGILEDFGPEVWEDFQTNFIDLSA